MQDLALWNLALQAFAAVLVVLAALAGAVMVLTRAFGSTPPTGGERPQAPGASTVAASQHAPGPPADPFVMAAIHAAVCHLAPGAEVTRVDEVP